MTAAELMERMSYEELLHWMALDGIRQSEHEKAQRLADKGMIQKRPRRR